MVNSLSANTSVQNGSDSFSCTHDQRVRNKFMLIGFQQEQVMNEVSKGPLAENIVFSDFLHVLISWMSWFTEFLPCLHCVNC